LVIQEQVQRQSEPLIRACYEYSQVSLSVIPRLIMGPGRSTWESFRWLQTCLGRAMSKQVVHHLWVWPPASLAASTICSICWWAEPPILGPDAHASPVCRPCKWRRWDALAGACASHRLRGL